MEICSDVCVWARPTPPQVRHGCWTRWSSVRSSGGGEGDKDLSACPPAGGRMDSTPALLDDIWTCSPLNGGVSSTDCQDDGESIDTGGGGGLPWVDRREVEAATVDWEEGRRVDGGDVSGGLFLLEGKICWKKERQKMSELRGKESVCK